MYFVKDIVSPSLLPVCCLAPFPADVALCSTPGGPTVRTLKDAWLTLWARPPHDPYFHLVEHPGKSVRWSLEPRLPLIISDLSAADPASSWHTRFRPDAKIRNVLRNHLINPSTEYSTVRGLLENDHVSCSIFAATFPDCVPTHIIMLLTGEQRLFLFRQMCLEPADYVRGPLRLLFRGGVPDFCCGVLSGLDRNGLVASVVPRDGESRKRPRAPPPTAKKGGKKSAESDEESENEIEEEVGVAPSKDYRRFTVARKVRFLPIDLDASPPSWRAVPHVACAISIEKSLGGCLSGKEGHTMFPLASLRDMVADRDFDDGLQLLTDLRLVEHILWDDVKHVTLAKIARQTRAVSRMVNKVMSWSPVIPETVQKIDPKCTREQHAAIVYAMQNPITVVTGGPGTGKSHWTRELARVIGDISSIMCLAPTGRAADNMPAGRTIHRVKCGIFRRPARGARADGGVAKIRTIIVDESSMLAEATHMYWGLAQIIDAFPDVERIVFLGDVNQLPPIGSGNFLHDLIQHLRRVRNEAVHTFTQNHRSDSSLHDVAQSILRGVTPTIGPSFAIKVGGYADVSRAFVDLGARSESTLTLAFNGRTEGPLLEKLLRAVDPLVTKAYGAQDPETLALGDYIVITKNCILQGVSNGTMGRITELAVAGPATGDKWVCRDTVPWKSPPMKTALAIKFQLNSASTDGRIVTIQFGAPKLLSPSAVSSDLRMKHIRGGRVLTVHKAQGGQADNVIFWLRGYESLSALYTGITRAKKKVVVIVADAAAFGRAMKKRSVDIHSLLRYLLLNEL